MSGIVIDRNIKTITMNYSKVLFYPVGNGDTTLIKLEDKTTIQVDCNIRNSGEDESSSDYDVKKDILDQCEKDNGNPYLDVFILTHPDQDHCRGFEKHYYNGDPKSYSDSNRDSGEIIIGELLVTSRLFVNDQCDDANALKKEAKRRKKLYDEKKEERNELGNRLRIIGYDGTSDLENIPHSYPGDILSELNGKDQEKVELFFHAPFKEELIDKSAEKDRNASSIVFQLRFYNEEKEEFTGRLMLGGDADHYIWEKILEKSEENGNYEALKWDVFLAPHHCSWTYFNDVPYSEKEENKTPQEYSLKILDYKLDDSFIIASSKEIIDDDDNPPHFPAKEEYLKKVEKDNFLNTATYPDKKEPEPIEFRFSSSGTEHVSAQKKKSLLVAALGLSENKLKTTKSGSLSNSSGTTHKSHKFFAD
jgi:hypothetical protein